MYTVGAVKYSLGCGAQRRKEYQLKTLRVVVVVVLSVVLAVGLVVIPAEMQRAAQAAPAAQTGCGSVSGDDPLTVDEYASLVEEVLAENEAYRADLMPLYEQMINDPSLAYSTRFSTKFMRVVNGMADSFIPLYTAQPPAALCVEFHVLMSAATYVERYSLMTYLFFEYGDTVYLDMGTVQINNASDALDLYVLLLEDNSPAADPLDVPALSGNAQG